MILDEQKKKHSEILEQNNGILSENGDESFKGICLQNALSCEGDCCQTNSRICEDTRKQKKFNKTVSVVNPYQETEKKYRDAIAELGGLFFTMLDEWQKYGASTAELRTFCNGCGSAWFKRISDSGTDFSSVVGAGYADYKETGDWLETIPEAPLSVCLREFFLYSILYTEHGKAAAKFALHSAFPELKDSFLYRCIDEDGNEFFVNQEGEVIS